MHATDQGQGTNVREGNHPSTWVISIEDEGTTHRDHADVVSDKVQDHHGSPGRVVGVIHDGLAGRVAHVPRRPALRVGLGHGLVVEVLELARVELLHQALPDPRLDLRGVRAPAQQVEGHVEPGRPLPRHGPGRLPTDPRVQRERQRVRPQAEAGLPEVDLGQGLIEAGPRGGLLQGLERGVAAQGSGYAARAPHEQAVHVLLVGGPHLRVVPLVPGGEQQVREGVGVPERGTPLLPVLGQHPGHHVVPGPPVAQRTEEYKRSHRLRAAIIPGAADVAAGSIRIEVVAGPDEVQGPAQPLDHGQHLKLGRRLIEKK
ncbi:hypothetical protein PG990_006825 [Apiospora arundinis]